MASTHDDSMTHGKADSGGSTIRAVRIAAFGGAEVLEVAQVPIPQPVDDEVLVRVHAASVNPVDGETRDRSWRGIKAGGILVSTLSEPDADTAKAHDVRTVPQWLARPNTVQLGQIGDLVAAGEVTVTVAATYPLAKVAAAQERLEQGHVAGKIVLTLT